MGVQKFTFDGASVNAKVDADLYHFLLSNQVGILKGYKNQIDFTVSGNKITFKDGYASIYGRLIYVENNTDITVSLDSSKKGFVILGVNTSTNDVSIYLKEGTSNYPSRTITNLSDKNGLYELVLCAYSKTKTSLTIDRNYNLSYIEKYTELINEVKREFNNDGEPRIVVPTKVSNGVYTVNNVNSTILTRSIIVVQLTSAVVTLAGALLFIT